MTLTTTEPTVRKVAGNAGAEISGVDLSSELEDETVVFIRQQLVANKVVFFRHHDHLDNAAQVAFARRLGTVTVAHPTVPGLQTNGDVLAIEADGARGNRANRWHTDVTFVDRPPAISILRAVTIPAYGGDTVWANTASAYQSLPDDLRELANRLWARHDNQFDYARTDGRDEQWAEYAKVFSSTTYETLHPVVRVHPESGERALLLGGFVRQLIGLGPEESSALFQVFQSRITTLEHTVRWSWQEGDVAIWDNRATQHYAIADYATQRRVMRRVTVAGDLPVGIDGRTSRSLVGDAGAYNRAV